MIRRLRAIPALFLLAAGAGCTRAPGWAVTVLLGDSKAAGELRAVSLASGKEVLAIPLSSPCGDLARGPGGEIYFSSGREVFLLRNGAPVPVVRLEDRVDSVLPSRDGRRLYLLQHPPARPAAKAAPSPLAPPRGGDPGEREGPHRLRLWDLAAARFAGELELHPLAYEIHEGPGLVLATHLLGRRVEIAGVGPEGFTAETAEELRLDDPSGATGNQQVCLRAAAIEPGGGWALLVENGAGGDQDRAVLWTLELPGRKLHPHPLAARGFFQGGIAFLRSPAGRPPRAVLNGGDRLLVVECDPATGVREEGVLDLPGFFHDLRPLCADRGPDGAADLVLRAGEDLKRRRGFLAAVDPAARRVTWLRQLPAAADVLEIE